MIARTSCHETIALATKHMELDKLQQQLAELEVDGVEQTGKTLGSGSYGVVVEMKVRGLR